MTLHLDRQECTRKSVHATDIAVVKISVSGFDITTVVVVGHEYG